MHNTYWDMLYLMACGVNRISPADACTMSYKNNIQKINELYILCKAHFADALVGSVLKQSGVNVGNIWNEAIAKSIRKVVLFDAERAQILSYMESQGIWYLPLKGIIMKELYPAVGMRQMSDNDILFDADYSDTMHYYMVTRGYETESFGMGNHDVYKKAPVYNFELHRALYGSTGRKEWVDYYADVKKRLIHDENSSYGYHLRDEDFYVYITCHAYKHYCGSGTGVRTLLDFYVYLISHPDMDMEYIQQECRGLGIDDFEEESRRLCRKIFSNSVCENYDIRVVENSLTPSEKDMLAYYLTSGAYGSYDRLISNRIDRFQNENRGASKFRYMLHRLFPEMDVYREYYPFFYRHKLLLPVGWLYRIIRLTYDKDRRRRAIIEAKVIKHK